MLFPRSFGVVPVAISHLKSLLTTTAAAALSCDGKLGVRQCGGKRDIVKAVDRTFT